MLKRLTVILCALLSFSICVSAVISADITNDEPDSKVAGNVITVENYLVALYDAIHTEYSSENTDMAEVLTWAESTGILDIITESEVDVSNMPLTQEMALTMLSYTFNELTEVTDMIKSLSTNTIPMNFGGEQSENPMFNYERPRDATQTAPPFEFDSSNANQQETTEDTSVNSEPEAEKSDNITATNPQGQMPEFNAQPTNSTANIPEERNSAGNRPDFGNQGGRTQGGTGKQMPTNQESANRGQKEASVPNNGLPQTNVSPLPNQTDDANQNTDGSTPSTDASNMQSNQPFGNNIENDRMQYSQTAQNSEKSLGEHIKEYAVTYISLIILAAAFVFIKLYRRRRY